MTSWMDTNLIRIPLARALERSDPSVNTDEAMKGYGTTCTDGQIPVSYTPFGEVICESMPIDPVRMSLAVIITLIVLSVLLLLVLPLSIICVKHYVARRRQRNLTHIAQNPDLMSVPVLTRDEEWAASPIIEEDGEKQNDGALERATGNRGWGVFRGCR